MNSFILDEMIKQLEASNSEVCALLIGRIHDEIAHVQNFCIIENIATHEQAHYVMEPQQLMNILSGTTIVNKQSNVDLCGIFHTHPNGLAIPSTTDIEMAKQSGYKVVYVIAGSLPKEDPEEICRLDAYYWNGENFKSIDKIFKGIEQVNKH